MQMQISLITGLSIGFEYVLEENAWLLDLGIFRLVFFGQEP